MSKETQPTSIDKRLYDGVDIREVIDMEKALLPADHTPNLVLLVADMLEAGYTKEEIRVAMGIEELA